MATEKYINGVAPTIEPDPKVNRTVSDDTTSAQTNAPDIMSVLRNTDLAASISPEGTEYIRQFQANIKNYTAARDTSFEIHTLGYPAESQCVIYRRGGRRTGIVLVFDEAITKTSSNLPSVGVQYKVYEHFKSMFPDAHLLQMVVVTRHDYPKVRAMAGNVLNALIGVDQDDLTVDSLQKYRVEIVPNVNQVREVVNHLSGHGVPDRMDYGILINCVPSNKASENKSLFSQVSAEQCTLAAVTGYTTFIKNPTLYPATTQNPSGIKFVPVVHISSIVTPLQRHGMLALIIPLAAISFIDNGQWETPYRQFGGKGSVNIGNLMPGSNGQPFEVTNLQEYELFKASYLEKPVLVLDVSMGRFMIPGLTGVGMDSRNAGVASDLELRKAMAKFLKSDPAKFAGAGTHPLGRLVLTEYTGIIGMNGTYVDSRYADYLNLMIHNGSQMTRLTDLLIPSPDKQELTVNLIREFQSDFEVEYFTHRLILNPGLINGAKELLRQHVNIYSPDGGPRSINVDPYLTAGNDYFRTINSGQGWGQVQSPYVRWNQNLFG